MPLSFYLRLWMEQRRFVFFYIFGSRRVTCWVDRGRLPWSLPLSRIVNASYECQSTIRYVPIVIMLLALHGPLDMFRKHHSTMFRKHGMLLAKKKLPLDSSHAWRTRLVCAHRGYSRSADFTLPQRWRSVRLVGVSEIGSIHLPLKHLHLHYKYSITCSAISRRMKEPSNIIGLIIGKNCMPMKKQLNRIEAANLRFL